MAAQRLGKLFPIIVCLGDIQQLKCRGMKGMAGDRPIHLRDSIRPGIGLDLSFRANNQRFELRSE